VHNMQARIEHANKSAAGERRAGSITVIFSWKYANHNDVCASDVAIYEEGLKGNCLPKIYFLPPKKTILPSSD